MYKKILVMVFFWISFIGFFYCLFTKPPPPGTTLNISNIHIEYYLEFGGMFLFAIIVAAFICMSVDFLTKKDIK